MGEGLKRVAGRCGGMVYKKEQLRYTGRGEYGYERHYTEKQCTRNAQPNGMCWQHQNQLWRLKE